MIAMPEQQMMPRSTLSLADYNPRKISREELDKLKTSLKEFGFIQPVVARAEDGLVLGGHQRLTAFDELAVEAGIDGGASMVPVISLVGVSDARGKLLNLALNKISGDWDYDKLAALFDDLKGMDATLSGFDPIEIESIMAMAVMPVMTPMDPTVDVEEGLAEQARKFAFAVEQETDAEACRVALTKHGMTGPGNAADAFVAICRAVLA